MPSIQDLLHFRGQALGQFVLVATILAGLSMGGLIAMIASHERARLRSAVFVLLALASLAFILATLLSVLILPFMGEHIRVSEYAARGLLFLYAIVLFAIVLGALLLVAGLAGAGYMVSRTVGRWTLASVILAATVYALCVIYLAAILRHPSS